MSIRSIPDLSHLKVDDLVRVIKESNQFEIEKTREYVDLFLKHADSISSLESNNVEKILKMMNSATMARGDGGCGSVSGGCC
ncbi:hypothetical protein [Paenibacillus silagei]|uniref:YlbF family regulator n=1 Tax=Paenibacillus silagei TaxID=1670801 RepID=A0ABS4NZF0_9BACL|nr:hypothetical protein [Paenibacillus silagei]MBP2115448.1 hypothetical protein [Paenibacillus silagei]